MTDMLDPPLDVPNYCLYRKKKTVYVSFLASINWLEGYVCVGRKEEQSQDSANGETNSKSKAFQSTAISGFSK